MDSRKPAATRPSYGVAEQYAKTAREFQALSMLTGHIDAFEASSDDENEDPEEYECAAGT